MTATPNAARDAAAVAESYLAAWNETDPAARRALVAQVWTAGGTYTDPLADVAGHDALDATIAAVQQHFPGFVFRLLGTPDGHHAQVRFSWELGPAGGPAPVAGSDVAVLAEDG